MMRHLQKARGFTLVEMLVVAPIVILAIGAFLTVIISMTGEVIASRASNALSYNVQDALNRIEQDVKLSSSFLSTNTVALSNTTTYPGPNGTSQGYNDDTTVFKNVGGTSGAPAIIMNMVATSANPISANNSYIYLKDKPDPCATPQNNTPFTYNVVYFIKNDTLWRRVIMPINYTDTTTTVCAVPFQQPSCSPTYMAANAGVTFCKTNDIKLVEGVLPTDFLVQYFNGESTATTNTPASSTVATDVDRNTALQSATTVSATINAKQSAGGRDVSRVATIRASRLDTNASSIAVVTADGIPAVPTVNSKISDPTNVVFTWSKVAGATGYTMQYQENGGAWVSGVTNQNLTTFTVTDATHKDVVNARVLAINGAGSSAYGTKSVTVPLWTPMNFQNTWANYSTPYSTAAYTKTAAGMIVLKGLVKTGSGNIAQLPAGYRPAATIMFENSTNSAGGRVDIRSDGNINMAVGNNAWFSLDGISFMPSGTTFTGAVFQNGWLDYSPGSGDPSFQNAGYMTDSAGRVQVTGLIRNGTTANGTVMFTLPVGSRPPEYMHVQNDVGNAPTHYGIDSSGGVLAKGFGNNYLSLQQAFFPASRATGASCTTQWCALAMQNSWVHYGAPFTTPQYTKSSDGVVLLKGLVKSGTSATATIATLPVGYCPAETLLLAVSSAGVWARLDVIRQANGTCLLVPGAGASTVWVSLDAIRFMAE
jgi:type II secretory pathway pseudopilin PulG